MSQNSLTLATTGTLSGLAAVTAMNAALDTLNTLSSGASAPTSPEAGQFWHDTTANQLKLRSLDNTAWISIASLDETNKAVLGKPGGGGYLAYTSSTTITLQPRFGDFIPLAGGFASIGTGITSGTSGVMVDGVAGQALAANTAYYTSLYSNSGTPTTAYWTLASHTHVPDTTTGNVGVEVIATSGTPNTNHTLTGIVATNASTQFYNMGVASWFNPQAKSATTTYSTSRSTTSSSLVEIGSEIRNSFVSFANRAVKGNITGSINIGTGTTTPTSFLCLDGVSTDANVIDYNATTDSSSSYVSGAVSGEALVADGLHYMTHGVLTAGSILIACYPWTAFRAGFGGTPGLQLRVSING
jgi:hypothetical protein